MFGFPNANRATNFEFGRNLLKSFTLQIKFNKINVASKKENVVKILSQQYATHRDLSTNLIEIKNVNNVPQLLTQPPSFARLYFESSPQKSYK